jgi:hypothetical protein
MEGGGLFQKDSSPRTLHVSQFSDVPLCEGYYTEIKKNFRHSGPIDKRFFILIFFTFRNKSKVVLCLNKHHAMKAYWGSEGIAPRIL